MAKKINNQARTLATGKFISTIRKGCKREPSIARLLHDFGYKDNGTVAYNMKAALRALHVYGVHKDGRPFLYKENWDSATLMKDMHQWISDHGGNSYKKVHIEEQPEPMKKSACKQEKKVSLKFDMNTGNFVEKVEPVKEENQLPTGPAPVKENCLDGIPTEVLEAEIARRKERANKITLLEQAAKSIELSVEQLVALVDELRAIC